MITVHKFTVPGLITFNVDMPRGADVLTVQLQNGEPVFWAVVDTDRPKEQRRFTVVGTGHPVPPATLRDGYVGTWQSGRLVWHLFEVMPS